jgi:hypothetical protein
MYSTYFQISLKELIRFEVKSLLGRLVLNSSPPLLDSENNLLHLGCADQLFEGWVNADFFMINKTNFLIFSKKPKKPEWMLDLRYPLKCESNYWDGVFTEHTLEHLYPNQAVNCLKEILRTLKPKAWLRITLPDLRKYVDFYRGIEVDERFKKWSTGAEAIRALTQDFGHLSVWDSELLEVTLKDIGFTNVRQVDFFKGTDKRLLKESEARRWESLYMEAQKP